MPPKEISRHGRRLDEGGGQRRQELPNMCVPRATATRRWDQQDPAGPPSPAGFFIAAARAKPSLEQNLKKAYHPL